MKKATAFTLLELTIYLGVSVFLFPLLFGFFANSIQSLKKTIELKEQWVKDMVTLSAIRNDIISASMYKQDWDNENLIFKKLFCTAHGSLVEQWIGWEATQKGMRRIQGIWDGALRKWIKKNVVVFYCSLTKIEIKKNDDGIFIKGVTLACLRKNQQAPYELYIRLRNRNIA